MKMIELKRIGECKGTYVVSNGETFGCIDKCDIPDDEIVVLGKKDFNILLAHQEYGPHKELPTDEKVMVRDDEDESYWRLGEYDYLRNVSLLPVFGRKVWKKYDHIIPYSLFDPENPEKWNGTENDYGLKGRAR